MVPIDTLHETNNIAPENSGPQQENLIWTNHQFSGAMSVSFQGG